MSRNPPGGKTRRQWLHSKGVQLGERNQKTRLPNTSSDVGNGDFDDDSGVPF